MPLDPCQPEHIVELHGVVEGRLREERAHVETAHLHLPVQVEDARADPVVPVVDDDVALPGPAGVEAGPEEHARGRCEVEPAGDRHVVRLCLAALLPAAAHPARREGGAVEAVDGVEAERNLAERPVDTATVLPPRRRDDALLGHGPLGSDEDGRLVELVDQPHRDQQHSGPQPDALGREEIDVRELDEDLFRVLDLDFGVEEEAVVEPVAGVQDRAQEVELVGFAGRVVLVEHLAVAGD